MTRKERLAQAALLAQARTQLEALHGALHRAYGVFNTTADSELLEASILEIGALRARCDAALRSIKAWNGEMLHGSDPHHPGGHRRRTHRAASAAAEKADQARL